MGAVEKDTSSRVVNALHGSREAVTESIHTTARVAPKKADFRPALPSFPIAGLQPEKVMAKLTYSEQLRHPNWQRKRLEAMEAAGFECSNCGDKESTLNVHHKRYVKGRMAWEYDLEDLAVLCEPCHATEHAWRERLDHLIASEVCSIEELIGFLSGKALQGNFYVLKDFRLDSAESALGFALSYGVGGDKLRAFQHRLGPDHCWVSDAEMRAFVSDPLCAVPLRGAPDDGGPAT